ncbi:T9SS type A sorting domain-containing protein [Taibaiella koreensis]|uniref:T9SS type A sorting domain-containing protein n=1 Tax=Taibaiella koreensis TaxID=1268548 RepID=UPI000E59CC17|nr:T9SS type A sorting domain-containing protein [Taibaiella koreensis]
MKNHFLSALKGLLIISGLMIGLAFQAGAQTSNVSGTVFNDVNRNTRIDAGESFTSLPNPLYIYLVRLNAIVDSAHVSADGTYMLQAPNNQTYTLELSAQPYVIGLNVTTTPIDHTPLVGWATTGENASGTNTGNGDLIPNSIMQVNVFTTSLIARNFGITCRSAGANSGFNVCANEPSVMPLADFISGEDVGGAWTQLTGSGITFDATAGTIQLTGMAATSSYRYDMTAAMGCPASSSVATVTVKQIPVANQSLTICAGDSACIVHPGLGSRTLNMNEKGCYTTAGIYADTLLTATGDGCDSIVITTLIVNSCGSIDITGSVFNDANGNTIINAGEIFTALPVQLYVYLVNSNNFIVDSASVAVNGNYLVQGLPGQAYTLSLSAQQYPLGTKVADTSISNTLPADWVITGENGNNNIGTGDGTPDGSLSVILSTGNLSNQNFGITESNVLPIGLYSFEAANLNSSVLLRWRTASEENNQGFEIERSTNGSYWTKIGFVNSKSENGNSNARLDYRFIDNGPTTGKSFYRLKQIDQNGGFAYSNVAAVMFRKEKNAISLYPNPASNELIIEGLEHNATICIMNTLGQNLRTLKSNENQVHLNVSDLVDGVYYIVVTDQDDKEINRQKFLKQ